MSSLDKYKTNIHSQNGEDGVILEILVRITNSGLQLSNWVCEFGAWDGMHCSNTFLLVERHGHKAVYIEGDAERFRSLLETCEKFPDRIVPINKYVMPGDLDDILGSTDIPEDFDILSIDIDSWDYQVWMTCIKYKPKIVVIEINSGIAPGVYQYQTCGDSGTSFTPMLQLGRCKGYTLVCHTGNMIFVRDDLAHLFDVPNPPESAFCKDWLRG